MTVRIGMTLGNLVGGRGFAATAASLLLLALTATVSALAVGCLFLLGFCRVSLGPAVTSRLINLSEHGHQPRPSTLASDRPVTFFVPAMMGVLVARSGMTPCPCRMHDPGGVVARPGGIG